MTKTANTCSCCSKAPQSSAPKAPGTAPAAGCCCGADCRCEICTCTCGTSCACGVPEQA